MLNSTGSDSWFALYTRHQHEKVAARSLEQKGIEAFLPLYRSVRQWTDREKELMLPLFPCYVFVRGILGRLVDVVSTPGAHHLISFGGKPAPIPEAEMEGIRRLVASRLPAQPYPFLRCGDHARVIQGPLTGVVGVLTRWKGSDRLVLSVEMLQRSCAVEIAASQVEREVPARIPSHVPGDSIEPGWSLRESNGRL